MKADRWLYATGCLACLAAIIGSLPHALEGGWRGIIAAVAIYLWATGAMQFFALACRPEVDEDDEYEDA